MSALLLPLAAMPSLKAPAVAIVPSLVSVLALAMPTIPAPRLPPVPPPPDRLTVPLFVIWLLPMTLSAVGDVLR